jgi:hypothetical protein
VKALGYVPSRFGLKVLVPTMVGSAIIGHHGATVKGLMKKTGTKVTVSQTPFPSTVSRVISVSGTKLGVLSVRVPPPPRSERAPAERARRRGWLLGERSEREVRACGGSGSREGLEGAACEESKQARGRRGRRARKAGKHKLRRIAQKEPHSQCGASGTRFSFIRRDLGTLLPEFIRRDIGALLRFARPRPPACARPRP